MADKMDFQEYQFARWKQSGLSVEEYLKKSGLDAKGYVYDKDKGAFDHPDSYLGNVDPNTIPSTADRNLARAAQGLDRVANGGRDVPRNAQGFAVGDVDPRTGRRIDAITVSPNAPRSPDLSPPAFDRRYDTGLTPENQWRETFPSKSSSVQPIDFRSAVAARKQAQADANEYFGRPVDANAIVEKYKPVINKPALAPSTRISSYTEPPISPEKRNFWLAKARAGELARPEDRNRVRQNYNDPSIWYRRRF